MEPLVVEFEVESRRRHAFETWTQRCGLWWPKSHTISGDPAAITVQPMPGGRIFERAADGAEHEWGEVLDWEPPGRVRYLWHLFFDRAQATEVDITFTERDGRTLVRIEQTGWERLGDAGVPRREKTGHVWALIGEEFRRRILDLQEL